MPPARTDEIASLTDRLVRAVLEAADPRPAVRERWPLELQGQERWHVLSCGKASLPMAAEAVERLGNRRGGVLCTIVPELAGSNDARGLLAAGATLLPVDHPAPTERNVRAAERVARFVDALASEDALLVLVSGGASAHLTLPIAGLALPDVADVSAGLMRAGAPIRDLNCVRKHVEQLKGGRLAARCRACRIVVLVLSDVIGDPLDAIGSGPCAPDPTTYADAIAVLNRWGMASAAGRVLEVLFHGRDGRLPETPKPADFARERVSHHVIANNDTAVDGAVGLLRAAGVRVESVLRGAQGEAASIAGTLVSSARTGSAASDVPRAWVVGGEPTVRVGSSNGRGGPSQELALAGAELLRGEDRAVLVAFSTDGADGPTDAAGAVVTGSTWDAIARQGLDPKACLDSHASHAALDRVGALIRMGPTGTNVNHVGVLVLA